MLSLTRSLARLTRARTATQADFAHAERFVRDWLGSYVAGAAAPVGVRLRTYGEASRGLEGQVFLAGALSHVTETDDLHPASITHPGCVVVSTALLLGRRLGVRGHAVLHAVLAGYEVMTRVGESLGPAHYRIFHNTSTAGVFGSAAAAATLLGLDEDQWVWAFGNAGTQAAGLWQFNDEGAMTKPLHAGHAAAAGLRAALLAREGFTGAEAILEGEKGLYRGMCPDARPDAVLAESEGWKLPETSMKPYPCCRHTHPAIDAALEVRERSGGAPPTSVRIITYPAALDVTNRPSPRSKHEAHFSIQYCVATALLRGRPGLEAFESDALQDPLVRTILGSTFVETSAELAAAYPLRWGAGVEIESADGNRVGVLRRSAKGDADAPLDDAELDAKVLGLFGWAGVESRRGRGLLRRSRKLAQDGRVLALPKLAEAAVP
jgi:2-methylcitrate dehydratase PrpD